MNQTNDKPSIVTTIIRKFQNIDTSRLGWIKRVDEKNKTVWVDYEKNPTGALLPAKISNPWITFKILKEALTQNNVTHIDFENGDPQKPMIRDIFFTLADRKEEMEMEKIPKSPKCLHLEADEIILTGRQRIIIQSGNAKTVYNAKGGELIDEAEQIDSNADFNHRIKGGNVIIN